MDDIWESNNTTETTTGNIDINAAIDAILDIHEPPKQQKPIEVKKEIKKQIASNDDKTKKRNKWTRI